MWYAVSSIQLQHNRTLIHVFESADKLPSLRFSLLNDLHQEVQHGEASESPMHNFVANLENATSTAPKRMCRS